MKPLSSAFDPGAAPNTKQLPGALHSSQNQDSHDANSPRSEATATKNYTFCYCFNFNRTVLRLTLPSFQKCQELRALFRELLSWNSVPCCPNLGTQIQRSSPELCQHLTRATSLQPCPTSTIPIPKEPENLPRHCANKKTQQHPLADKVEGQKIKGR